jgi:hypothetical protein
LATSSKPVQYYLMMFHTLIISCFPLNFTFRPLISASRTLFPPGDQFKASLILFNDVSYIDYTLFSIELYLPPFNLSLPRIVSRPPPTIYCGQKIKSCYDEARTYQEYVRVSYIRSAKWAPQWNLLQETTSSRARIEIDKCQTSRK